MYDLRKLPGDYKVELNSEILDLFVELLSSPKESQRIGKRLGSEDSSVNEYLRGMTKTAPVKLILDLCKMTRTDVEEINPYVNNIYFSDGKALSNSDLDQFRAPTFQDSASSSLQRVDRKKVYERFFEFPSQEKKGPESPAQNEKNKPRVQSRNGIYREFKINRSDQEKALIFGPNYESIGTIAEKNSGRLLHLELGH